MGPFDAWPTGGGGFEHFYGFIGGETNQYAPALYDGTVPIEPDRTPEEGYHLTEDMTDRAIDWVRQQKALMPDKPFFAYFAPGATHAPHHVPPEWSDKYKGRFDAGWDALREETFARQKELGVIPPEAELTDAAGGDPGLGRHARRPQAGARAADGGLRRLPGAHRPPRRPPDRRARGARGPRRHARLLHRRRQRGVRRGHAAGHVQRDRSRSTARPGSRRPSSWPSRIDEFGTIAANNHYAVGWAHAMDTPYQWTKQVASHWGGTRNGTVVHWPNGFAARGEVRAQFSHVIDIAATVLDAAGLPGRRSSTACSRCRCTARAWCRPSTTPDAAEHRETQYFEMFVNRGIYHKGWTAVTRHSIPWKPTEMPAYDDDVWELYAPDDWTQAHDLSAEQPERLRRAAAAVPDRGGALQRAAARRPPLRALQPRPRRPAAADPREDPAAVRGHGAAVGELGGRRQEQVARGHGAARRARGRWRGRAHRPGRRVRRLEPLSPRGASELLLQLLRPPAVQGRRRAAPSRQASTRCAWSSPTTAAASARAAT